MTRKDSLRRLGSGLTCVALTLGASLIAPTTASAGQIVCDPGEKFYSIIGKPTSKWVLTHVAKQHVATKQTLKSGTKIVLTNEDEVSAEFTQNASVAVSAGVSFSALTAEVKAEAGLSLVQQGSHTSTSSVTYQTDSTIAQANYERDFAVYQGTKKVSVDAQMKKCSADRKTIKSVWIGSFTSYVARHH